MTAILLNHHSKVKWAKEEALPEIERLSNEFKFTAAFSLVQKAKKYISNDPEFKDLAFVCHTQVNSSDRSSGCEYLYKGIY